MSNLERKPILRYRSAIGAITSSVDDHMIALMRLVLALSALIIIYLDPAEPDRYVPITYTALIAYTLYSALLYFIAISRKSTLKTIERWSHWADACWYLVLIALSSGTNSIFFFFFFFSILIASFRWGFASGLRVVFFSAILFTLIGYVTAPAGPRFELNRFLLRPIYLVALGYMMAYWGGSEITLKRRLAMLKEISTLSNPRFGVERTIDMVIERLRAFYDANTCMLMAFEAGEYRLYRARLKDRGEMLPAQMLDPEFAARLLILPEHYAVSYARRLPGGKLSEKLRAFDLTTNKRVSDCADQAASLSFVLEADSLITAPLLYNREIIGRIYLTAKKRRVFDYSDIDFLLQCFEQVIPVIENIRLVDRLASDAAEEERQRIARNIHDSVIQPYLGLQIGLRTVRQNLWNSVAAKSEDHEQLTGTVTKMVSRLDQLIDMTNAGIDDLRTYITGLKGSGGRDSTLLPSIRRFATKFGEATGITVQVLADGEIHISDRLAAEVFQMVVEGLSNIRRHTQAEKAAIRISCDSGYLKLHLENDRANDSAPALFMPRSISSRAESLGGRAEVSVRGEDRTIISVIIPL